MYQWGYPSRLVIKHNDVTSLISMVDEGLSFFDNGTLSHNFHLLSLHLHPHPWTSGQKIFSRRPVNTPSPPSYFFQSILHMVCTYDIFLPVFFCLQLSFLWFTLHKMFFLCILVFLIQLNSAMLIWSCIREQWYN